MTAAILIDDDPIINYVHKRVLEKTLPEMKVVVFQTAAEALDFLQAEIINPSGTEYLLFVDINMPEINGWEFLTYYEQLGISAQVYMLTSSLDPGDVTRAKGHPTIKAFLNKPLTMDLLRKTIVEQ